MFCECGGGNGPHTRSAANQKVVPPPAATALPPRYATRRWRLTGSSISGRTELPSVGETSSVAVHPEYRLRRRIQSSSRHMCQLGSCLRAGEIWGIWPACAGSCWSGWCCWGSAASHPPRRRVCLCQRQQRSPKRGRPRPAHRDRLQALSRKIPLPISPTG